MRLHLKNLLLIACMGALAACSKSSSSASSGGSPTPFNGKDLIPQPVTVTVNIDSNTIQDRPPLAEIQTDSGDMLNFILSRTGGAQEFSMIAKKMSADGKVDASFIQKFQETQPLPTTVKPNADYWTIQETSDHFVAVGSIETEVNQNPHTTIFIQNIQKTGEVTSTVKYETPDVTTVNQGYIPVSISYKAYLLLQFAGDVTNVAEVNLTSGDVVIQHLTQPDCSGVAKPKNSSLVAYYGDFKTERIVALWKVTGCDKPYVLAAYNTLTQSNSFLGVDVGQNPVMAADEQGRAWIASVKDKELQFLRSDFSADLKTFSFNITSGYMTPRELKITSEDRVVLASAIIPLDMSGYHSVAGVSDFDIDPADGDLKMRGHYVYDHMNSGAKFERQAEAYRILKITKSQVVVDGFVYDQGQDRPAQMTFQIQK